LKVSLHDCLLPGLLLVGLVVSAGAAAGERPSAGPVVAAFARVDSLARAGDWEVAVAEGTVLLADPRLPDELLWRLHQIVGLGCRRLDRQPEALDHLEKAVLWGPSVPENHRNLASLLMAMGRRGRALSEYREACDLAPDDPVGWVELAHARMDLGLLREAGEALDRARALAPDAPAVNRALVRWLQRQGREAETERPLRLLLAIAPDRSVRRELALVLLHTGRPDQARDLYAGADRDTLGGTEQRILLEADRALADPGWALQLALRVRTGQGAGPTDPDFWATAALLCHETGHTAESLLLWDRAIALAPDDTLYRHDRDVVARELVRQDR